MLKSQSLVPRSIQRGENVQNKLQLTDTEMTTKKIRDIKEPGQCEMRKHDGINKGRNRMEIGGATVMNNT
jgi:hypothetical protein